MNIHSACLILALINLHFKTHKLSGTQKNVHMWATVTVEKNGVGQPHVDHFCVIVL